MTNDKGMRREIQFCGFGGQGIILAGYITGKAAALYDHCYATLTQSYGPESRGGACATEVVVSDEEIDYPKATQPEVIAAMSQEAYETYAHHLQESGTLIIDEDLVTPSESRLSATTTFLTIPATRYAERLGRKIVANMVMLGFLTAVTDIVSAEAMRQAIASTVPKGTEDLNLKAFEEGYRNGKEVAHGLLAQTA
jgi:2-oxoglutarate ferredoxin oxidoreductase subunit gamma